MIQKIRLEEKEKNREETKMSDNPIPIGPIVGAAVGLGIMAGAVKITRDVLDASKEEKAKQQARKKIRAPALTTNNDMDRVERGLNKMLGR